MESSRRAPGYDLFKLIVAILLAILFLFLVWRQTPQSPPLQAFEPTRTLPPATEIRSPSASLAATPGRTEPPEAGPTIGAIISRPQETATATATALAETAIPSPTDTPAPTHTLVVTLTPLPSPAATTVIESAATAVAAVPASMDVCEVAGARSRLETGRRATILRRLNFRSSPGIRDNWILTNIPGTQVEVVGGPECVPHLWGAYVWWQIQLPDGRIGWSAEGSLHGTFYFMEPEP